MPTFFQALFLVHIRVILVLLLVGTMIPTSAFEAVAEPQKKTPYIILFKHHNPKMHHHMMTSYGGNVTRTYKIIEGIAGNFTSDQIAKFKNDSEVASIEPDLKVRVLDSSVDTQIRATPVQIFGDTGQGVKVAVLDTGIDDADHEFNERIAACQNDFANTTGNCEDDHGHGTLTAGVLGATGVNPSAKGVAPGVSLYIDKVLSPFGNGTLTAVLAGIDWAVANHVQVISMSLGFQAATIDQSNCDNDFPAFTAAVNNAVAAGVTVVVAAGNGLANDGFPGVAAPACLSKVIAVGAVDSSNNLASFSSTGPSMADHGISAPGVGVFAPVPTGGCPDSPICSPSGYNTESGTSLSAPEVAGTIALMLKANPALTPAIIRDILFSTACTTGTSPSCPTGTVPNQSFGYGRVDALSAFSSSTPIQKTLSDTLALSSSASRIVSLHKTLSDTLALSSSASKTVSFYRALLDSLTILDSTSAQVLSLSVNSGPVGTTTILSGTGFTPSSIVTLSLDTTTVTTANTDGTGHFTKPITIPAATFGIHTIVAADGTNSATIPFTINSQILSNPDHGLTSTSVVVTGSGFASSPATITTFTFNGSPVTLTSGSLSLNSNGGFTAIFNVPVVPSGPKSIVAIDSHGNSDVESFTVKPPITLSVSAGQVNSHVTVSGNNFIASSPITISYDGNSLATTSTGITGSFGPITITIPPSTHGTHGITATDGTNTSLIIPFAVSQMILSSKISGSTGTSTIISGTGFAASSGMTILYDSTNITPGTVTTSSTGSFSATITIPSSLHGIHSITATDASSDSAPSSFNVNTAAIISTPSTAIAGTIVSVTGSGLAPNSHVTITFGGTVISTTPGTVTTDSTGSFSATIVPASPVGQYIMLAKDAQGNSASALFYITKTGITSSQISGPVGSIIHLTGTGFTPSSAMTILYNTTNITPGTVTTSPTGSFSATITIPSSIHGTHGITATDSSLVTASTSFVVNTATVTPSPILAPTGTIVTLTGNGFAGSSNVAIKFNGLLISTTPGTVTTGITGSFSATITIPPLSFGSRGITATDSATVHNTATSTFVVMNPSISLNPNHGLHESTIPVTVTGVNFIPNSAITIKYDTTIISSSHADATGHFVASVSVPISTIGSHTVSASDGTNTYASSFARN